MVVTLLVQNQHIGGIIVIAIAIAIVIFIFIDIVIVIISSNSKNITRFYFLSDLFLTILSYSHYNIGRLLIARTHDETRIVMLEFPVIIGS
jgi:hypothetical protein